MVDGHAQAGITLRTRPALARGHGKLTAEFGEKLAALLIVGSLGSLDLSPLAVT
jgi:hypothetical protein